MRPLQTRQRNQSTYVSTLPFHLLYVGWHQNIFGNLCAMGGGFNWTCSSILDWDAFCKLPESSPSNLCLGYGYLASQNPCCYLWWSRAFPPSMCPDNYCYSKIFPQMPRLLQNPHILRLHFKNPFPGLCFDWAAQGSPYKGGARGIIHFDESTSTSFAENLGKATNNFSEFMAVKLLLILPKEKGIPHINIYGNSMLVIRCLNGSQSLHNYTLHPVLKDIRKLLLFSHTSHLLIFTGFLFSHTSHLLMFTGFGTRKQTNSPKLDWQCTKEAGKSGKRVCMTPQNFFMTLGPVSDQTPLKIEIW